MSRAADVPQPAECVTVRRWQRFGCDRLYGHTADGRDVGWIDLDTGERSIELPGFAAAFERAAEAWRHPHLTYGSSSHNSLKAMLS